MHPWRHVSNILINILLYYIIIIIYIVIDPAENELRSWELMVMRGQRLFGFSFRNGPMFDCFHASRPPRCLHVGAAGANNPLGDFELVLKNQEELASRPDVILNANEEAAGIPATHPSHDNMISSSSMPICGMIMNDLYVT